MFTKLITTLSTESIPDDPRYTHIVNDSKVSENGVGRIVGLLDKQMKMPPQSTWLDTKDFVDTLKAYSDDLKGLIQSDAPAPPLPPKPRQKAKESEKAPENQEGGEEEEEEEGEKEKEEEEEEREDTGETSEDNTSEAELFQFGLENVFVIERELMEQQKAFEQSFREQFLEPMKAFLVSETHKMQENKSKLERCKRDYEVAKTRANQYESQALNNTSQKLPDGDRLFNALKENEHQRDLYENTLAEFVNEAEITSSNRYVVVMQAFRMLIMQQLARHKLAIATIEAKEEALNSIFDRIKAAQKRTAEERARSRAQRQEERAKTMLHKFDILKSFTTAYPDELLNASLEPQLREYGDDVVKVVSATLESQGLAVDKLNNDIQKHILKNKDTNINENKALFALRSTSGFSRFMSTYSKMCCTQWLNTVIADPMTELIAVADQMEINPQKCKQKEGKTQEESYQENVDEFKRICQLFLDSIFESTAKCPV